MVQISFSFFRISVSVGGVLETRRLGCGDGDGVGLGVVVMVVVDLDDEGTGGTFWDDFAIVAQRVNVSQCEVINAIFDLRVLGSES